MDKDKVLLTGFGPFREHKINASWEAVKLLPQFEDNEIDIIVEQIPVTYTDVETKVKKLWEQHNPTLVIHVGVSSLATKVTIESKANRCGYRMTDCIGLLHPTGEVCTITEGSETIHCEIDVHNICKELNKAHKDNVASVSNDAGRYLCEYIFYKSLHIDSKRTMFVHVPPLNKPFSAEELAATLLEIIREALKQLKCNCNH